MALPLLNYPLETQNSRVSNLAGDASTVRNQFQGSSSAGSEGARGTVADLIEAAYRQVFFHAMRCDREPFLESQLRAGNITTRDFIRGLLLSERFQQGYYQCNSNYRMVDQVVGRVLGRSVHGDTERRAWSIVIASQGFTAFVDQLLNSEEYMASFGYDLVPQQRSRVLPGRSVGETPIYQQFPRYGSDWRDQQWEQNLQTRPEDSNLTAAWTTPPAWVTKIWLGLAVIGGIEVTRILLIIASEMYGTR